MRGYTAEQWADALRGSGVGSGDTVFLSTQLYGLGPMQGAGDAAELCARLYAGVRDVIGSSGTLAVPTFTQQVGRYGVPYVHEQTECLTGIFSEYVRNLPGTLRSLHPVFSVSAQGPKAAAITADVSPVAFGRNSAFDRLYRLGGKAVCAGFDYYSGHITSFMHYVETTFAVPYYYNKYVLAEVSAGGRRVERDFVLNVRYRDFGLAFYYNRYIDALARAGEIAEHPLGRGAVYSVDIGRQVDIGFDLLHGDVHAFLVAPPQAVMGRPPFDGPPDRERLPERAVNWPGFLLGSK